MHVDDVEGAGRRGICLSQGEEGSLGRAISGDRRRVVDMDHVVGVAVDRVDRHIRRLMGTNHVFVSHHRLLELIRHRTATAAAHAVGQPGEAGGFEIAVVVVLQREVPVLDEGHVDAGVDTAEPGHNRLAHAAAFLPLVVGIPEGVATHADHASPLRKGRDVGTHLEVRSTQGRVEAVGTHQVVLAEDRAGSTDGVGGRADRDVAVASQVAPVGKPLARHTHLMVGMAKLAEGLGAHGTTGGILVQVAVVIPVDAHAQQRAAEHLLADETHVGEEAAVD